jgi:Zn-dependent protease with chaperone function
VTAAATASLVLAIAMPHLLPLSTASPAVAASIWLSALALRALTVVLVAIYLVLFVPHSEIFNAVTHWCWETVLPLLATPMGVDGHRIGDAVLGIPPFLLAFSGISVAIGVVRATRSIQARLLRSSLGHGPQGSLIVGGREVLFATAGMTRPRVLVSAGALTALDDEELGAGLEHERAHIVRRHRFVLVFAELCRAFARFLPGTKTALDELRFHLERDADRWAVSQSRDPCALASAICKAAASQTPSRAGLLPLAGRGHATRRVDELLAADAQLPGRLVRQALACVASLMICFTVVVAISVPATALAGARDGKVEPLRHCTG